MVAAVAWLCAPSKPRRAYYVHGPCAPVRDDVVDMLCRDAHVARFDAREHSGTHVFETLELVPLAFERGPRVIVVANATAWAPADFAAGLDRFLDNRARYPQITLVFSSDAPRLGHRRFNPDTHSYETEFYAWETRLKESGNAQLVSCPVPEATLVAAATAAEAAPAARWLSLRLPVTQRQAEWLWSRSGASPSLARDVVLALRTSGLMTDAREVGMDAFRSACSAVLSAQGPEEFAEAVLFGRVALAMASCRDHDFGKDHWRRTLSYLSQRLDWLSVLHDALASNEELASVQKRLGIHQKWILTYANRHVPSSNIAKSYTRKKVAACRMLLARSGAALERGYAVPPGFGEVLAASW